MTPFINKCVLQGRVISDPVIKALSSKTNITTFRLLLLETWVDGDGNQGEHKNRVVVEVIGRDSAWVKREASRGCWATIEGYVRTGVFKGQDVVKVRTLNINLWRPNEAYGSDGGVS